MENQRKNYNLIGKQFGKLTVISKCEDKYRSPQGKTHTKWNCVCVCGNISTPDTGSLNSGKSKSCGCFVTPEGLLKREKTRKEDAGSSDVYSTYKINARKRGYEFKISKKEAIDIFKKDCYYCGSIPSSISKKCAIPFFYNGIDRKDNSIGYTLENCLPCCARCNKSKMILSYDDFLEMVTKIYNNLIKNYEK